MVDTTSLLGTLGKGAWTVGKAATTAPSRYHGPTLGSMTESWMMQKQQQQQMQKWLVQQRTQDEQFLARYNAITDKFVGQNKQIGAAPVIRATALEYDKLERMIPGIIQSHKTQFKNVDVSPVRLEDVTLVKQEQLAQVVQRNFIALNTKVSYLGNQLQEKVLEMKTLESNMDIKIRQIAEQQQKTVESITTILDRQVSDITVDLRRTFNDMEMNQKSISKLRVDLDRLLAGMNKPMGVQQTRAPLAITQEEDSQPRGSESSLLGDLGAGFVGGTVAGGGLGALLSKGIKGLGALGAAIAAAKIASDIQQNWSQSPEERKKRWEKEGYNFFEQFSAGRPYDEKGRQENIARQKWVENKWQEWVVPLWDKETAKFEKWVTQKVEEAKKEVIEATKGPVEQVMGPMTYMKRFSDWLGILDKRVEGLENKFGFGANIPKDLKIPEATKPTIPPVLIPPKINIPSSMPPIPEGKPGYAEIDAFEKKLVKPLPPPMHLGGPKPAPVAPPANIKRFGFAGSMPKGTTISPPTAAGVAAASTIAGSGDNLGTGARVVRDTTSTWTVGTNRVFEALSGSGVEGVPTRRVIQGRTGPEKGYSFKDSGFFSVTEAMEALGGRTGGKFGMTGPRGRGGGWGPYDGRVDRGLYDDGRVVRDSAGRVVRPSTKPMSVLETMLQGRQKGALISGATMPDSVSPEARAALNKVAKEHGLNPAAISMMIDMESKWKSTNRTGSYVGLTQISGETMAEAGWGFSAEQFRNMPPEKQIEYYGKWLDHYKFNQKMEKMGVDLSKLSPAEQATIIQGFQFGPNAPGWIGEAFVKGNMGARATDTDQAPALGDTSARAMKSYFEKTYAENPAKFDTRGDVTAVLPGMKKVFDIRRRNTELLHKSDFMQAQAQQARASQGYYSVDEFMKSDPGGRFGVRGGPPGTSQLRNIHPQLAEGLIQGSILAFGDPSDPNTRYEMRVSNTWRSDPSSKHGQGKAADVQIFDRHTGKFVGGSKDIMQNAYGNPHTYNIFQALARGSYQHLEKKYGPEVAKQMSWGGNFFAKQGRTGAARKYGLPYDQMHYSWGEGGRQGSIVGGAGEKIRANLERWGETPAGPMGKDWVSPYNIPAQRTAAAVAKKTETPPTRAKKPPQETASVAKAAAKTPAKKIATRGAAKPAEKPRTTPVMNQANPQIQAAKTAGPTTRRQSVMNQANPQIQATKTGGAITQKAQEPKGSDPRESSKGEKSKTNEKGAVSARREEETANLGRPTDSSGADSVGPLPGRDGTGSFSNHCFI